MEFRQKVEISSNLPTRPGFGDLGRKIRLLSNCFKIKIPSGFVYHYDVDITRKNMNLYGQEAAAHEYENIKRYRCLNTKKNRRIVELMLQTSRNFEDMYPAYDGMKTLYTRNELRIDFPLRCEVILPDEDQGNNADPQNMRREVFDVLIKPVKKEGTMSCAISLDALHAFFAGRTSSIPQETIAAIETILRHRPCLRFTPVGRCFFYPPDLNNLNPLGGGLENWFGFHQSIRIGQWAPTVVLNTTATTFWQAGPVLNFAADLLSRSVEELNRIHNLTDADIRKISKKIKNRKCVATHFHNRRIFCMLKLTRDNARNLSFDMNGERITIVEYFRQRYNIVLRFPNLPCVQVKPANRNVFLPIEVCNFIPGEHAKAELTAEQRNAMIQFTTLSPRDKLREIKDIRRQRAAYEQDGCVRHFEMEVSPEPLALDGRVLDPPSIEYKNGKRIRPNNGSWNMRDIQFVEEAPIKQWILLNFEFRLHDSFIDNFVQEILKQGRNLGIPIGEPFDVVKIRTNNYDIEKLLRKLREEKPNTDLAIVVLPSLRDLEVYGKIKRVSEILIGLTTQCIKAETVKKVNGRGGPQIVCNLWSKINAKMGGQNIHLFNPEIPDILRKPVILIGADVNHPPPSARPERQPSLAACVGSLNRSLSRYAVSVRPQTNTINDKKTIEEILDLEAMVKELLKEFYRSTQGKKPEKILFYRDGVSEGQFRKVREHEVACVRRACKSLQSDYEPGLTFIIVQKRHSVRFFPKDPRDGVGKVGNVPPGTVVDTDVTHKMNHDFYLSSQNGLIGMYGLLLFFFKSK